MANDYIDYLKICNSLMVMPVSFEKFIEKEVINK